ncbi:AfsR/SARP family transcriptional regulator [Umezawaea beigongshangensis]|uniref:AfsR/SARP family transcriptional regulator n=1 Tax=Umezawaea beigongshangensis TaxID=2780383 RepID=UPI0018F22407|nr:BTAD domain-containing putative transcriptional regulator [Umezawaea beigongshangensis]
MPDDAIEEPGARAGRGLELGVLGPLQVLADGRPVPIGRRGVRGLLALLVVEAGRTVPVDRIVDGLWGDAPPATARTIVHGYVSRLRRLFRQADPSGSARIVTTPTGYQLEVDPWRLDLHRARELVAAARGKSAAMRAGLLREALGLWRGRALADVPGDPVTTDLDELRLVAIEERIAAELDLGRHLELVGELRQLVTEHPFRERLVAHTVRALYRSGQRADALDAFLRFQRRAADELGIDPGPELRALHEQVLRDDPALSAVGEPERSVVPPRPGVVVPAQLPGPVGGFVGREADLARLDAVPSSDASALAVLTGPAGVGKTALAVAWGHRRAGDFPDGVLFAELRGLVGGDRSADPAEVLERFLLALGVLPDAVPGAPQDRLGLYRSLLARRRVLVVLDDAASPEQVRPLLPSGPGSVALVTSRLGLGALVVSGGARLLTVDVLDAAASARLVREVVGERLTGDDAGAVDAVAELCGRLPLALRIAAAKLLISPKWTVEDLVRELSDDDTRLRSLELSAGAVGVARALDASYRALPPHLREAFAAVGRFPGHQIGPHVLASVCGTGLPEATGWLAGLAEANLLTEVAPGAFAVHDLVRLYARALPGGDGDRRGALVAVLRHYLVVCDTARRLIGPPGDDLDLAAADAGRSVVPSLPDRGAAIAWFAAEWPVLVPLVRTAAEAGLHEQVWQLVRLLHRYCAVRSVAGEWPALVRFGLESARASGSALGEMLLLSTTCATSSRMGTAGHSLPQARRAHEIAVELGDSRHLVITVNQLATAQLALGRHDEALANFWESVRLAARQGDRVGEARGLNNVAQAEQALGARESAVRHQERAVRLYEDTEDRAAHVLAITNLAELHADLGQLRAAEEHARRGIELARLGGSVLAEAFGRQVLGRVLARRREWIAARAELTESLRLYEQAGSPRALGTRAALESLTSDV